MPHCVCLFYPCSSRCCPMHIPKCSFIFPEVRSTKFIPSFSVLQPKPTGIGTYNPAHTFSQASAAVQRTGPVMLYVLFVDITIRWRKSTSVSVTQSTPVNPFSGLSLRRSVSEVLVSILAIHPAPFGGGPSGNRPVTFRSFRLRVKEAVMDESCV